jgi:hypothetical protein
MAHHRLGHAADAQRCREQAARWIDEADRSAPNDASGTRPSWGDWQEPVLCRRLLREVDDLMRSPASTPRSHVLSPTTSHPRTAAPPVQSRYRPAHLHRFPVKTISLVGKLVMGPFQNRTFTPTKPRSAA